MKGFFKKIATSIAQSLINSAKDEVTKSIKSEISPYVTDEPVVHSNLVLFGQMDTMLKSIKDLMVNLKIKSQITDTIEDDINYEQLLSRLKEFSSSVILTIQEIEKI